MPRHLSEAFCQRAEMARLLLLNPVDDGGEGHGSHDDRGSHDGGAADQVGEDRHRAQALHAGTDADGDEQEGADDEVLPGSLRQQTEERRAHDDTLLVSGGKQDL